MQREDREAEDCISWKEQQLADPYDLSEIPPEFFLDPDHQNRVFMGDKEELGYLRNVVASFFNYRVGAAEQNDAFFDLTRMQRDLLGMSSSSKQLVEAIFLERFEHMRLAIVANYQFLTRAASSYQNMFKWKSLVRPSQPAQRRPVPASLQDRIQRRLQAALHAATSRPRVDARRQG